MKGVKIITECYFCGNELEESFISRVDSSDNSAYRVKTHGCLCEKAEDFRESAKQGKINI